MCTGESIATICSNGIFQKNVSANVNLPLLFRPDVHFVSAVMLDKAKLDSRAKIEDVAREAGVSIMSVSRAMRGVEGLSLKKRTEILKIAKRIGYEPSSVAGSLAAENSTLIGISVPTLEDAVFSEIFDGMRPVFNNAGFQTVFDTTEYQPKREERWIDRMISWRPAGIVLSGVDHSKSARRKLKNSGIPTLEIWDYSADPIDLCVGVDHYEIGYAMARHLLDLGYERPAYVGVEYQRDQRADKRMDGFRDAFEAEGHLLVGNVRLEEAVSFEAGKQGLIRVLETVSKPPDVVYFLNDHMAFGGMQECDSRGISVPDDLGIVGFNGLNINNVLPKQITTSITPRTLMGSTGSSLLVAHILKAANQKCVALPVKIFPGDTVRSQLELKRS